MNTENDNTKNGNLPISDVMSCLIKDKEYYIKYIHTDKMFHQAGFLVQQWKEKKYGYYEYIGCEKDNDGDCIFHFYSNERGFDIFLNEKQVKYYIKECK